MQPAARITDMHACPVPLHVGGPILAGAPQVLIGCLPAARAGDPVQCVVGTATIAMGSARVLIGNMPAARLGDPTSHGGTVVSGEPRVLIG